MSLSIDYAKCAAMLENNDAVCVSAEEGGLSYCAVGRGWKTQLRAIVHGAERANEDLDIRNWELALSNYPTSLRHIVDDETTSAAEHKLGVLCATSITIDGMALLDTRTAIRGFLGDAVVVVKDGQ